jgi:hypothetical protein
MSAVSSLERAGRPRAAAGAWVRPLAPPRASETALFALGTLCLQVFLLAQFLSLTRLFWSQRFGEGVNAAASAAGVLSVGLLLVAAVVYGLRAGNPLGQLVDAGRLWLVLVTGLAAVLFLYGWQVKGYRLNPVAHDLCPYLVLVGAVVLGSLSRVWVDLDRPLLVLLVAALVVNALGMTQMTDVVFEGFAEDRAGIGIVAYRTQGALAFWPLLFLTARMRGAAASFLVYASVFFVLAQQILFQKRGPSVRVLLFVLVFLLVLPRLQRLRPAAGGRGGLAAFTAAFAVVATVALSAAPWLFEGQLSGLMRRMSGERYSGGPAAMLTWQNERFFEAGMFLRTLEPQEYVLGRGFGGHFVPDTPGWGVYMEDLDAVARRQLHVGALMPLFKGGLALALVYYAGTAAALARGRRFLGEPLAGAAFFVVLIHALFLLQEGFFIMSVAFDLVMVGLCMGYLLSKEREA